MFTKYEIIYSKTHKLLSSSNDNKWNEIKLIKYFWQHIFFKDNNQQFISGRFICQSKIPPSWVLVNFCSLSSLSVQMMNITSLIAIDHAMYSASVVESAIRVWSFELKLMMIHFANLMMCPDLNFDVLTSPATLSWF